MRNHFTSCGANVAAVKVQIDLASAKWRARHVKRYLQKVGERIVKLNLAGRNFFTMKKFVETLKLL
jgi:PP-loop superfamily ATP-utilizing enzyme